MSNISTELPQGGATFGRDFDPDTITELAVATHQNLEIGLNPNAVYDEVVSFRNSLEQAHPELLDQPLEPIVSTHLNCRFNITDLVARYDRDSDKLSNIFEPLWSEIPIQQTTGPRLINVAAVLPGDDPEEPGMAHRDLTLEDQMVQVKLQEARSQGNGKPLVVRSILPAEYVMINAQRREQQQDPLDYGITKTVFTGIDPTRSESLTQRMVGSASTFEGRLWLGSVVMRRGMILPEHGVRLVLAQR